MASNGEGVAKNGVAAVDERVEALRAEMSKHNVQAYIIPTEDPHMVCSRHNVTSSTCEAGMIIDIIMT
jgi:hypothetical protein